MKIITTLLYENDFSVDIFICLLLYFGRVPDTNFNRSLYLTIYEEKFNVKFAN